MLSDALERAVVVARRDAGRPDAPTPPAALGPVLRFARLPPRAMRTVCDVLDADEAFRTRVAEGLEEPSFDRASWLFLVRPDGWAEELELLAEADAEERQQADAGARLDEATRRAEQLEAALEELRAEHDSLAGRRSEDRRALREARAELDRSRSERDELNERTEQLDRERSRAVRELQDARELAHRRLLELQELERERAGVASTPEPTPGPHGVDEQLAGPPPDTSSATARRPDTAVGPALEEVGGAVAAAAAAAAALAEALGALASALAPGSAPTAPAVLPAPGSTRPRRASSGRPPAADPPSRPRSPRRVPVRLQRGVRDDSPEAVEQLLARSGLVAIVDGYNVSMERWPALDKGAQRGALVDALGALAARFDADIHVVFDGVHDGTRPAVAAPLPVRVHFSRAGEQADDDILAMVAELPADRPVLVVSTDRAVAAGAQRLGANTARSDQLIGLLGR